MSETAEEQTDLDNSNKKKPNKYKKLLIGAVIGYVAGCVLTLIWFFVLTSQMHCPVKKSTIICSFLALALTLGLAYNRNMRCISVLIIPMLFSSKGRSTLVAFAFVLAMTGPAQNILTNIGELSRSVACGQQQLKTALDDMLDIMKRPLVAVKEAIRVAMEEMRVVLKRIERVLLKMRDAIAEILRTIKSGFDWLGSIVGVCNKQFGTPFDRCMDIAKDAMADCREKLGYLKGLCSVTNIFKGLCYSVKFIDVLCILVDFVSDSIVGTVTEKLKEFNRNIQEMFSVSVSFKHDFHFSTTSSKNISQVGKEILLELQNRTRNVFLIFGWTEVLGSVLFAFIILKALFYKAKYLKQDRFDNHFITKSFLQVDEQRKKMKKDTVLPLTRKEKNTYVPDRIHMQFSELTPEKDNGQFNDDYLAILWISSLSLVRAEVFKMARSVLFLVISCIQLFCICFVDYSLFWLLGMIRYHGLKESGIDPPPYISVKVTGSGFIADIYSGLIRSFQPMVEKYDVDPTLCLPDPREPNFRRYFEIGGIVFLAWVFVILEPYALRLRQVIMDAFYPERARERSVWLYNHILLRRENFITLARRQARRKFLQDDYKNQHSILDWLRANTNSWWIMRKILGSGKIKNCMLCGSPLKSQDNAVACSHMGCNGKYCKDCFAELNNACFLCKKPLDYGDLSDVSEEKDSSEDELDEINVHRSHVNGAYESDNN